MGNIENIFPVHFLNFPLWNEKKKKIQNNEWITCNIINS